MRYYIQTGLTANHKKISSHNKLETAWVSAQRMHRKKTQGQRWPYALPLSVCIVGTGKIESIQRDLFDFARMTLPTHLHHLVVWHTYRVRPYPVNNQIYTKILPPEIRPPAPPRKRHYTKRADYWATGISKHEREQDQDLRLASIRHKHRK
jgi:hypothetical protein